MYIKKYKNTDSIDFFDDSGNFMEQLTPEESEKMIGEVIEITNHNKCKECRHAKRNHSKYGCYTCKYNDKIITKCGEFVEEE